jgi:ABC-type transporter Mla MlaB component
VSDLDSAGLALFGELMQRNPALRLAALPADFESLRQAYRLDPRLQPQA